jgi:hypothetical protein
VQVDPIKPKLKAPGMKLLKLKCDDLRLKFAFRYKSRLYIMGILLAADGAPTLAEFLDIFDTTLDIDLDSENVWPLPPPLKFL